MAIADASIPTVTEVDEWRVGDATCCHYRALRGACNGKVQLVHIAVEYSREQHIARNSRGYVPPQATSKWSTSWVALTIVAVRSLCMKRSRRFQAFDMHSKQQRNGL
jgi:hypothetical protein